ncbi:MAG: family 78 glycoside hydrolase catalytic domain [Candidatus Coproplasma sp.]
MLTIRQIRINGFINPIGIDGEPEITWTLFSDEGGVFQTEYELLITGCGKEYRFAQKCGNQRIYAGQPFERRTRYEVILKVKDNLGRTATGTAFFETGIKKFTAEWITDARVSVDNKFPMQKELSDRVKYQDGCPIFIKNFSAKKVVKARLYTSACGVYKATLNGKRIDNIHMAPGWTNYKKRIEYQSYDVTNLIGESNELEICVGNGWYRGTIGYFHRSNVYGDMAGVIAELYLTYEDGSEEVILSDESWQYTTGKVRYSEIYYGETVDFTAQRSALKPVKLLNKTKDILISQECPPARECEQILAKELIITPLGETVIDFGQNVTGFVRAKLKGERGKHVVISHAEVLDEKGNFYTVNLRGATAADEIILSGGEDVFQPSFTFHGFRYIKIDGLGKDINLADFTAVVCHSDIEVTGEFSCSHKGLTQLQRNILWGQKGNFFDIPTDCPQRDERLGWTGDAQVFFNTAAFNMDVKRFFTKWMRDVQSEQNQELGLPTSIPDVIGEKGTAAWGDVCTIIPSNMYIAYGDKELLKEQYPTMKFWVDRIFKETDENGLWINCGFQHGDWLALDGGDNGNPNIGATDVYYICSAFYAHSTYLTMQAAEILGYDDDARELKERYEKTLSSFRREYITETGRLVSDTQTAAVLALHFNLCEERHRQRILKGLVENIHRHNDHIVTGFIGTPYILHVLSENGEHELAGKIVRQEDFPSWLYAVNLGATTIWERWNSMNADRTISDTGMTSFNHYAYGSVGEWFYKQLCGIKPAGPGYKGIIMEPKPVTGIDWAQASLDTLYGKISCRWEKFDGAIKINVSVPVNTEAELTLPVSGNKISLNSGNYEFKERYGEV